MSNGSTSDRTNVVLLGAGFSIPFGGYSVDDLTDRVRGELWSHSALRDAFVIGPKDHNPERAVTYEEVLGSYQTMSDGGEDQKTIENAIISVLEMMDGDMRPFRMNNEQFCLNTRYQEFFRCLGEGAVVFTLNHDLWFERFLVEGSVSSLNIVGVPETRNSLGGESWPMGSHWLSEHEMPRADSCELSDHGLNIVKLHGALNWRDEEGSLIVMGANKEDMIKKNPVLAKLDEFKLTYLCNAKRVMIVGYGFGDPHINESLRFAALRRCEFFVFDVMSFHKLRKESGWARVQPRDFSDIFLPRVRHYSSLGERVFHYRLDPRIEAFLRC